MARKTTISARDYITGKSTDYLINMSMEEFLSLDRAKLAQVVSRMGSTINKRIDKMVEVDDISPVVGKLARNGGEITTAGKDINELRAEYKRAREFLTAKSGTLAGWREIQDRTLVSLQKKNINLNRNQLSDLWRTYEHMNSKGGMYNVAPKDKYQVLSDIADRIVEKNWKPGKIVEELESTLQEEYEKEVEEWDLISSEIWYF